MKDPQKGLHYIKAQPGGFPESVRSVLDLYASCCQYEKEP